MTCSNHNPYAISGKHWYCDGCDHVLDAKDQPLPKCDDTKLDVFESRQEAWFFEPAQSLLAMEQVKFDAGRPPVVASGDIAAAAIISSYFEGIQHYRVGTSGPLPQGSRNGFMLSFDRILGLPQSDDRSKVFYDHVRCGLFHAGMAYGPVLFDRDGTNEPVRRAADGKRILVDPTALLAVVRADFAAYVKELRAGTGISEWRQCWDDNWENS